MERGETRGALRAHGVRRRLVRVRSRWCATQNRERRALPPFDLAGDEQQGLGSPPPPRRPGPHPPSAPPPLALVSSMTKREDALDYHAQGRPGKIAVVPTKPLNN